MSAGPAALATALQQALAGEHAAVYAYGVAGGVLGPVGSSAARARDGYGVHRDRRDRIEEQLRALDEQPVAAEPGYGVPAPVTTAGSAVALARRVEDRCAVLHAAVVAASTDALRREAMGWLDDAATRVLGWGGESTAFPGVAAP